ncbi:MAG: GNAT family N-acetyltransferase [Acidimicrobiales bacterium]
MSGDRAAVARTGPLVIRPVDAAEHQAVADLIVSVYADVLGGTLTEAYKAHLADVASRAEEAVVLVAVLDTLVGSVTYVPGLGRYAEFEADDEAGIRMLVVAPDRQRLGIGSALMQVCIDRARAEGRSRLSLHTTPMMAAAHHLYDSLGFRRAPERDWVPEPGVQLLGYVLDL